MNNLITKKQWLALLNLGFQHSFHVSTVDEVIDWLRRRYNVIIFDSTEPYVDPIKNCILYCYRVKYCNKKWGWNAREYLGVSKWSKNPYAMKRQAIWIAIRYINRKKEDAAKRRSRKNRK